MIRTRLSALLLVLAAVTPSLCFAQSPRDFTDDSAFLKFLERVEEARYQFNLGNVMPSLALWSATDDVTLMGAGGGMEKGISEVKPRIAFVTQQRTRGSGVAENKAVRSESAPRSARNAARCNGCLCATTSRWPASVW